MRTVLGKFNIASRWRRYIQIQCSMNSHSAYVLSLRYPQIVNMFASLVAICDNLKICLLLIEICINHFLKYSILIHWCLRAWDINVSYMCVLFYNWGELIICFCWWINLIPSHSKEEIKAVVMYIFHHTWLFPAKIDRSHRWIILTVCIVLI